MTQFLIVYDQRAGSIISINEFRDEDRDAALDARFTLERQHAHEPHVEVVALGADDRAALERTHGRYFKSVAQLAEEAAGPGTIDT